MSKIEVMPETLKDVAIGLTGLCGELLAVAQMPAPNAKALGGGNIGSTIDAFHKDWYYAIGQLDGKLSGVVGALHHAAESYEAAEGCTTKGASW